MFKKQQQKQLPSLRPFQNEKKKKKKKQNPKLKLIRRRFEFNDERKRERKQWYHWELNHPPLNLQATDVTI